MTSRWNFHQRHRNLRDFHPRCHLAIILLTMIFVEEGSSQACPNQEIQCYSGYCVPFSSLCNGVKNCPDGSDEFYCSPANISYALIWSTTTVPGSRPQLYILYGDPDAYRAQMQLNQTFDGTVATRTITGILLGHNYQSLETDVSSYGFYFSDGLGQNILYGPIASAGSSYNISFVNVIPASDSVTGLSIDWVSKLLYWSDATYKRIGVMSSNTWLTWAPVVEDGVTSPRDVVVYPQGSFLFWSDVGSVPKIERLDLTDGVREVIVSNANLQRPTTLVIDFVEGRLLFLDSQASRIGSVLLDGSNLTFWSLALFSRISSFSLFKGYIFLGDMKQGTSYVYNFTQQTYVGSISFPGETGIIDLTVYEKAKQPAVQSPCNSNNGECEQFCITFNATSRICKCAMGYFLNTNGISCDTQVFTDNFLLVADLKQQNIFQVYITTGEVRAAAKMPSGFFWPTSMDYDPQTMKIYAFDYFNKVIRSVSISTQTSTVIEQTQGAIVLGIAIDTVGRLLYYIDGSQKAIVQMTLSGVISTQTVLSEPNSQPNATALDVYNRFIFWSNCYQLSSSTIEQADIASISNHHSVVSGLSACPTAIAVDFWDQVIYWGDTDGKIKRVGYDGTGQSLVYDGSYSTTIAYVGLALDETSLYISDFNQRVIRKLNKTTLELSNLTALRFVSPVAIVLYSSTLPTVSPRRITTSVPGSDSSTKIIVPCVVIPIVLILVIIAVFVVKKFRRNSTKAFDNGSVYDDINEQQVTNIDSGIQNQRPDHYEGLKYDYLNVPGQRRSLPEDYLHLKGQREGLPDDYVHVKGLCSSLPNDYLRGRVRRGSLPDDYMCLSLTRKHKGYLNDGYLHLINDVRLTLQDQMFSNVGKRNEFTHIHLSNTTSNDYI